MDDLDASAHLCVCQSAASPDGAWLARLRAQRGLLQERQTRAGTRRQTLLLRAVDEIHDDGEIGDTLWAQLAGECDEERLIELCLLIGHYEMLAATLKSLRVQRDS